MWRCGGSTFANLEMWRVHVCECGDVLSYGFMFLSTVFQSFGDDGRVNMKGSVQ